MILTGCIAMTRLVETVLDTARKAWNLGIANTPPSIVLTAVLNPAGPFDTARKAWHLATPWIRLYVNTYKTNLREYQKVARFFNGHFQRY